MSHNPGNPVPNNIRQTLDPQKTNYLVKVYPYKTYAEEYYGPFSSYEEASANFGYEYLGRNNINPINDGDFYKKTNA